MNPRSFVRKTMTNFFRTSKTVDNISNVFNAGHRLLTSMSSDQGNQFQSKSSSHLSHSQPSINENLQCNSSFRHHTGKTPLIERRIPPTKDHPKKSFTTVKPVHSSRQELHLRSNIDRLPRSRSCADRMEGSDHHRHSENDSNQRVLTSLQPRTSDTTSLRSGDSTGSSLSAYLPAQQQMNTQQTNPNTKNQITKSQESIFSFSSPISKPRSIKSLIMAAATKDTTARQDNDVLVLIASWVLRSPEDFQGRRKM